jgi:hypothetical protein
MTVFVVRLRIQAESPNLRIIDQALWDQTRPIELKRSNSTRAAPWHAVRWPAALRCDACGGPITAINGSRYGCSAHKDKGPTACSSSATWRRTDVDQRLLAELREDLLSPEALAEVQTTPSSACWPSWMAGKSVHRRPLAGAALSSTARYSASWMPSSRWRKRGTGGAPSRCGAGAEDFAGHAGTGARAAGQRRRDRCALPAVGHEPEGDTERRCDYGVAGQARHRGPTWFGHAAA